MSAPGNDPLKDTVISRILRYERAQKICNYIGGGIGGLLVIVGLSGNAIVNAPWQLRALLITFAFVSAVALGRAYVGFLTAHYALLSRQKVEGLADSTAMAGVEGCGYPNDAYWSYVVSFVFLGLAGILLLVGIWWAP